MAEHWKSTPKYWCKHCTVYVKDTAFERKQHESTAKHQGNLKRFLSGIQKDHARSQREKEQAKAEVERLHRIAGTATTSPSSSSGPPPPRTVSQPSRSRAAPSAADQKRQWAQLADMGIAVPEHARAEMAMPGDWQTVSPHVELEQPAQDDDDKLNIGVHKRKLDDEDEREDAGRKGWGSTTKSYPRTDPRADHLDVLLAKPMLKKPRPAATAPASGEEKGPVVQRAADSAARPITSEATSDPSSSSLETPIRDTEAKLDVSHKISEINRETDDKTALRPPSPRIDLPVFKKRKAKQSPATFT